jgi:hypothetical protein
MVSIEMLKTFQNYNHELGGVIDKVEGKVDRLVVSLDEQKKRYILKFETILLT